MAPKRKATSDDEVKKPPKAKAAKAKKEVDNDGPDGWTVEPPSLIYRLTGDIQPGNKVAAFDLDGTLATTKQGNPFARGADDFKVYNKRVPKAIQELIDDGYKIVVFSNQNGIKSKIDGKAAENAKKRADNVMAAIKVSAPIFFATMKDEFRKPELGMWKRFVRDCNAGVQPDLEKSFFVGDAAGRPQDHSDSDKLFAEAIGIQFKTPEEVFGEGDNKLVPRPAKDGEERENHNQELCDAFNELAEVAQAAGEGYVAKAYVKAAQTLALHHCKVTSGKEGIKLAGIGKGCAGKIDEFLATGTLEGLSGRPVEEAEAGGSGAGGAGSGSHKKQKGSHSEAATMAAKFL